MGEARALLPADPPLPHDPFDQWNHAATRTTVSRQLTAAGADRLPEQFVNPRQSERIGAATERASATAGAIPLHHATPAGPSRPTPRPLPSGAAAGTQLTTAGSQILSGSITIAPQGHSSTQIPQPLQ